MSPFRLTRRIPAWLPARRALFACTVLGGTLLHGAPAFAQSAAPENGIGLDAAVVPRYDGGNSYRIRPLPVLNLSSGTGSRVTFFVQGFDGGVAFALTPSLSAGLLVGAERGRDQGDAAILDGTGDIATSFEYGAFARWHDGPASANLEFLQSAHAGYGNHVTLSVAYTVYQAAGDRISVGVDTVWSNGPAERTYFGIDEEQAANSAAGLPVYRPSSGFSKVDFKTTWDHRLNRHWSMNTSLGVGTLLGDAADSPIVERRTSMFGAFGVAYHF
ncbi:MipA/OmpV family protein [Burkholderia plantarii]|uniref:Putative MltA-interacting protein MipA n=1 Tax=Burkholderia plantarii TaxID=41899 RepID=A0A0B6S2P9_BURPL|nr:MipA/OmpV family protein [Burkholderia plantarii]AJK48684.1 putative MltA-interacting protein MipA [Burkholderia plantarii]